MHVDVLEDDEFELPRSCRTRLQSFSMVLQPWLGFRVRLQEVYKDPIIVVWGKRVVNKTSSRFHRFLQGFCIISK